MTMHQVILGHMGTDATAAASVTGVATQLVQCISMGLAAGGGIILGKMLGRNEFVGASGYSDNVPKAALNGMFSSENIHELIEDHTLG